MSERDTRPAYGEMPPHVLQVLERHEADLTRIFAGIFDEVMNNGDGRPAAELVNDALSLQSQVAAIAAAMFIIKLADMKGLPLPLVTDFGLADVNGRILCLIEAREASFAVRGATKQ